MGLKLGCAMKLPGKPYKSWHLGPIPEVLTYLLWVVALALGYFCAAKIDSHCDLNQKIKRNGLGPWFSNHMSLRIAWRAWSTVS